ncbi:MAG TPA: hypothetical protein PLF40_10095 [Kofleriaceae bacterium]|nr:hypothetical protein [Kofleriaceae bacterium]
MSKLVLLLPLLTTAACATASKSDADAPPRADARIDGRLVDAPQNTDAPISVDAAPDAAPAERVLKQNTSDTITDNNSQACGNAAGTAESSYYRAFKLSDFGITTAFNVSKVSVGIEAATAGIGTAQAAQIKIYTYSGALTGATLTTAQLTLVNAVNVMIDNTATPVVKDFPITASIPAGATVVAELASPDGRAAGNFLYIGSNQGGETSPAYIRDPACGDTLPTKWSSAGFTTMHVVMNVTGR